MYAIIKMINGNFFIHAEGYTTIESVKAEYHGLCRTLWSAPDVIKATVTIVDENMDIVLNCREFIYHEAET